MTMILQASCTLVLKYQKRESFFAVHEENKRLWFISNIYKKCFLRPLEFCIFALVGLKS